MVRGVFKFPLEQHDIWHEYTDEVSEVPGLPFDGRSKITTGVEMSKHSSSLVHHPYVSSPFEDLLQRKHEKV